MDWINLTSYPIVGFDISGVETLGFIIRFLISLFISESLRRCFNLHVGTPSFWLITTVTDLMFCFILYR
jgi:hypothetical protein